jgi:hypothetical protein
MSAETGLDVRASIPRHSEHSILRGLLAASLATAIASGVISVASSWLFHVNNIPLVIAFVGLLSLPWIAAPAILFVVFTAGFPLWLFANAFGWTRYRDAALVGAFAGVLIGLGFMVIGGRIRPEHILQAAYDTAGLALAGAFTGLAARWAAGPPTELT